MIPSTVAQESIAVRVQKDGITLFLKNIALFMIKQGQTIRCHPAPNVKPHQLSLALSGIVMAALLYQRGCFITHGSAVSISGQGILFLGDSGAGKSSLAIALHQRGYPIVTDDLAVIVERNGIPYMLPAFPQMRVTQNSAKALGLPWDDLIPLPNIPKRGFRFEAEFIPDAIPLRHVYVLKSSREREAYCQSLQSHQQIMELMHHSEVMTLLELNQTHHFRACARLAKAIPIDSFQRPMNWEALQNSLNIFERHVSQPSATG